MDRGESTDEMLLWDTEGSGTKAETQQYVFGDLSSQGQFDKVDPNMDWSDVEDSENGEKVENRGVTVDIDGCEDGVHISFMMMMMMVFFESGFDEERETEKKIDGIR